jgi:hypothetical protein
MKIPSNRARMTKTGHCRGLDEADVSDPGTPSAAFILLPVQGSPGE